MGESSDRWRTIIDEDPALTAPGADPLANVDARLSRTSDDIDFPVDFSCSCDGASHDVGVKWVEASASKSISRSHSRKYSVSTSVR